MGVILESFGLDSGIILASFGGHLGVILGSFFGIRSWSLNSDYTNPLGVETPVEIEFFTTGADFERFCREFISGWGHAGMMFALVL